MRIAVVIALICACKRGGGDDPTPPAPVAKVAVDAAAPKPTPPKPPAVDVATQPSPVWKPGPPVVGDGVVDGAALRERHVKRLAADTSPVTVLTGGGALELGKRLCEAVVPKRPPATPVLIKPNLGGFDWFHDPRTHHGDDGVKGRITDAEFVRGIVRCLKARGHSKITIADGFTGKPEDWRRLVKVSGYEAMAKDEGATLVAFDDDGVFDVEGDTPGKPLGVKGVEHTHVPTLMMAKVLAEHLDHGLVISAPKIKTHRYAVFSLGIKAMQGTVMYSDASPAFRQKWRSHREIDGALAAIKKGAPNARDLYVKSLEIFAERMIDVLEIEAPDVELAEGAPAMSGDGFEHLFPSAENVAIGGSNVVMVDRVVAQYLGLWANDALAKELGGHATSPLLETAAKRFGIDLGKPAIAGDGAPLLAQKRPAHLIGMAGFEIDEAGAGHHDDDAKELHAVKITDAPVIDGGVDEMWKAVPPLAFDTDWAGHFSPTRTTVRAMWSDKGLYMLWRLDGTKLNTDRSRPVDTERIDLYEEDSVELFLVPDPANRQRYFEIELGPYGHFFDLLVDRTPGAAKKSDTSWSGKLRIGTAQDEAEHVAIIEVAIEAPDVIAALKAGAQLPIGLYRMEGTGKREYLAAFPTHTPRPNFHVPEAFGTLVLEP
jgi:uncharacterized protein (DUF362 family)